MTIWPPFGGGLAAMVAAVGFPAVAATVIGAWLGADLVIGIALLVIGMVGLAMATTTTAAAIISLSERGMAAPRRWRRRQGASDCARKTNSKPAD